MRNATPSGSVWRRVRRVATLIAAVASLLACGITTIPRGTGNGCENTNCPPPARSDQQAHTFTSKLFSFQYFDPWQVSSQDSSGAVVSAATNFGDLSVQFVGVTVPSGTSAESLLTRAVQNIDTSQISGLTQEGPIYGAAIGYVAGAGGEYSGTANIPNAPSVPIFLEIMASTRGTSGIVFFATSSLDPSGPNPTDPRQVPNGEYDRMVNSVIWQ